MNPWLPPVQKIPSSWDPFRTLVYLEWLTLIVATVIDVLLPMPFLRLVRIQWVTALSIIAFAFTGLRRFQQTTRSKMTAIVIGFGLINIATYWGGSRLFALLYLVLVVRVWLWLPTRQSAAVTVLIFGGFVASLRWFVLDAKNLNYVDLPVLAQNWGIGVLLIFLLIFTLGMILAALLTRAIVSERRIRDQLALANEQLRQYALRIEDQATLQERNRIAREIHDSLGHALTGLNLQLETALKLWSADPGTARTFLADAKQLSATALRDVRESVAIMRQDPLQGQPLSVAIASLVNHCQRNTGIQFTSDLQIPDTLGPDLKVAVYRIIQEALTNLSKYSQATHVNITGNVIGSPMPTLTLTIHDNGEGFQVAQNTMGFGIQGMRERTLSLRGTFEICSQPGAGCKVQARFPLPLSSTAEL